MIGYSYKKTLVYDPSKSETYRAIQEEGYGNADYTQEVTVPVQPKVFHPNRMVPGKVRSEQLVIDYNQQNQPHCVFLHTIYTISRTLSCSVAQSPASQIALVISKTIQNKIQSLFCYVSSIYQFKYVLSITICQIIFFNFIFFPNF